MTKQINNKTKHYKNIICTFCGALCDDLEVSVSDNKIKKVKKACAISKNKFKNALNHRTSPRIKNKESTYDEVVDRAAKIMSESRNPLIYGLSSTTAEGQRAAIKLAESTGANIDSTSSVCHGPGTLSKQFIGIVSSTLGEVKNRSDLIIFWGCNPVEAHPNHSKRYSMLADGMYINDKSERDVIVVDVRETPTARMADSFYQVKPNCDFEIIMALRQILQGKTITADEIGGLKREQIIELAEKMKKASYGTVFFGMGLTMTRGKYMNTWSAMSLVRDLNHYTRFVIIPMRGHGNVSGSEITLAWQTGYPFAVNFSRGYPRYNPGEYTAVDLLARQEVDAAFIIASDPAANFPAGVVEYLKEIPLIVLDPHENLTTEIADIVIPTEIKGITMSGTVYRMDHVPLKLRTVLPAKWPSDETTLEKIEEGVHNYAQNK